MNRTEIDVHEIDGGYDFYFLEPQVYITAKSIHENHYGIQAEINIERPPQTPIRNNITVHLQDHIARMKLTEELARSYLDEYLPWGEIIEFVSNETILRYRQGEPIQELWTNQDITPPEYIVKPIIEKGMANILFAEQASAKTTTALMIAILAMIGPEYPNKMGLEVNGRSNPLVLDYENNENTTLWNLRCLSSGMEIGDVGIYYRRCCLPLAADVDIIRRYIQDNNINFVIIDSLGLAAGGELKESSGAIGFYAALRSLNTTSLILAHTSKGIDKTKTVFGSIYFENLAKNIWEGQKVDIADNKIRVALHHRKSNFSKTFPSIGLEYTFDLDKIYIANCDPSDEPTFREKMSISVRILKELESNTYTTTELAGLLNEKFNSVDHAIKRLQEKNKVEKDSDNKWGLI